jgi:hypothetical protein
LAATDDAAFENSQAQDLYPPDEDAHARLISWAMEAFTAAKSARQPYEDRWARYYKLYRSYVKRTKSDWRSKVFVPYAFSVIETITPKIMSETPKFVCVPVGPEDVEPAKQMEALLDYCASNTDLYLELIKAVKSALKYGTGILKTFYKQDIRRTFVSEPRFEDITEEVEEPVIDPETGQPLADTNGEAMTELREIVVGQRESGTQMVPSEYLVYEGPAAEAVDIFNFFVAPEADDIDTARYVIHRTYREMSHIMDLVKKGVYRLPSNMGPGDIVNDPDEPMNIRTDSIEMGGGRDDSLRKSIELWEIWTDDNRVITVANGKAILRVTENPFTHQQKPFVRVVDYLQEHEFWGVGEIETIEGLQDIQNALINQRLDNVRLVLNPTYAVDVENLEDLRDLTMRPGGVIRTKGGRSVGEVFQRVDLGDVTGSAFAEASEMERFIERVTGVTAYQTGMDSPTLNSTATGVAMITESGNTKFALKVRLLELLGLKRLARQWGSIIQQFTTEERVVRILGPMGQAMFQTLSPDSIQGALDYDIQTKSSSQTESVKKEQAMALLQTVGTVWPQAIPKLVTDVLEAWDKKDFMPYLLGDPNLMMMQQMMMGGGMPGDPTAPPPEEDPGSATYTRSPEATPGGAV